MVKAISGCDFSPFTFTRIQILDPLLEMWNILPDNLSSAHNYIFHTIYIKIRVIIVFLEIMNNSETLALLLWGTK